jgi:uncharacterized protein (DUF58 family)
MGLLWGVLAVLVALIWLVTAFDIVRRPLSFTVTVAWLLFALILPFVGSIVYWMLRKPPADEVQRAIDTERDIRAGAAPPRL